MKLDLTTGSIDKLIFMIAVPVALGYMFHNLLNITDTYFAGQISPLAVAALAKSFPVFFIIIAFSAGFSSALTGLISNAVGAKDMEEAKKLFYQGLSFATILSAAVTVFGFIFCKDIIMALSPSPETLELSTAYMKVIFIGSLFFVLNNFLNSALMAQGDSRTFGYVLVWECLINAVLDYVSIKVFAGNALMSVAGIAAATVAVQVFGAFYLGIKVLKSGFISDYKLIRLKPDLSYFKQIFKYGLPSVSNMVLIGVASFLILDFLSPFGDLVSAGYGIGLRIEQIFLLPAIGLSTAALSMVGKNYGAKNFERVKIIYRKCLIYASILCILGGTLIYSIKDRLFSQFSDDPVVLASASEYLAYAVFISIAYCILHITNSSLQGMRRPNFSLYIGLFRHVFGLVIGCIIALKIENSVSSIFLAIFIVNWLAAGIALLYFSRQKLPAS